jgi:hypothetical protein
MMKHTGGVAEYRYRYMLDFNIPHIKNQGCGSGLIQYGSGSSIFAQSGSSSGSGSGSGSKLKQNFQKTIFFSNFFEIKI